MEKQRRERVEGEMGREGMPGRSPEKQVSRREQAWGRFPRAAFLRGRKEDGVGGGGENLQAVLWV